MIRTRKARRLHVIKMLEMDAWIHCMEAGPERCFPVVARFPRNIENF